MSAPAAQVKETSIAGEWRVSAQTGTLVQDITYFRGAETTIGGWTWSDPFGPKQFSLTFPSITYFDRLGAGDLAFIGREVDVNIDFIGTLPSGYPDGMFRLEGYMESFSWSTAGLTVECKGAMYQLDNYQAKPEYPGRPIPFEQAIFRQWNARPDLRLLPPKIIWPSWWTKTYTPDPKAAPYLLPIGVQNGDRWTGLVTRSTGKWENVLTSYLQGLLSSMYTERGRFTMDLAPGRQPILRHRDFAYQLQAGHLTIDALLPGAEMSLNQDFSQSINVVYGQGKALTGEGYSGQIPTTDGLSTRYLPLAALRQVDPPENSNGWLRTSQMRRENLLDLQNGLNEEQAQVVAINHLSHFADPGISGTITLKSDPLFLLPDGITQVYLSRFLIKAGMTIQVPGLFGRPEGQLFHITEVSASPADQSVTLTIDSKYRDALTAAEVILRGRDSLQITRSLVTGQYQPPVSDQLLPWNYTEGSGFIPSGGGLSAVPLFSGTDPDIAFPWTEITKARPPSSKQWRHCYVRIGPKATNANDNWAYVTDRSGDTAYQGRRMGIPVKMSQAGSVRLLQIAAYDSAGNLLPVPFHISFYYNRGVNYEAMPMLRDVDSNRGGYATGQHYPFFDQAWENYNLDGTQIKTEQTLAKSSVGIIRGYGTGYVPAGYWPGGKPQGDSPTGQLVDEGALDYDCTTSSGAINVQVKNHNAPFAGYIFAMIYCDAQLTNEVFFVGRMYRTEPGTTG